MVTLNGQKFYVEFLDISLETVIWGNKVNIADYGLKKVKNEPKFIRDSDSSLELLTFQLSNVRELETIKFTFDCARA